MARTHVLLSIVIATTLLAPPLAGGQAADRCDFDGDGVVTDRERAACAESPPTYDRCDFDQDGDVERDEAERCAKPPEPCDFDRDGVVTERERAACAERGTGDGGSSGSGADAALARCDGDQDGVVTREEDSRCGMGLHPRCDGDGDGRATREELHRCLGSGEHARPNVDDGCRRELAELEEKRKRFHDGMRERHEAFEKALAQKVEAFAAENHTEEEWTAFRQALEEERLRFREQVQRSIEEFEKNVERLEACRGQGAPPGGHERAYVTDCRPDPAAYERFKSYVEEESRRFRATADEKVERFKAYQEQARERFFASNRTEEERRAFREQQAEEHGRLVRSLEEEALRHRAALDALWQEFKEKAARECLRGDAPREDVRVAHEDAKAERLACGLDVQAKLDVFYEEHGRDASAWSDEATEAFIALKAEARREHAACEARLHASWKADVKETLHERPKAQRMGSFEFTPETETRGHARGKYVAFTAEIGSLTIRDYAVQGLVLVERLYAPHDVVGGAHVDGSVLTIAGSVDGRRLTLKVVDNPTGGLRASCGGAAAEAVAGDPSACVLALPASASVFALDPRTGAVTFGDGEPGARPPEGARNEGRTYRYGVDLGDQRALLSVHGPHAWTTSGVEFQGDAHVVLTAENFVLPEVGNAQRDDIRKAVEERKVLAELNVVKTDAGGTAAEAVAYGGLGDDGEEEDVVVKKVEKRERGVSIHVAANASGARTLVINLDRDLFESLEDLDVTLYEVDEDGTERRVALERARSLAHVLDPDGAAYRYWIVADADGAQLLVSVKHFSEKRIEVQSAEAPPAATPEPEPTGRVPAPGAFGLLAAVAAAAGLAARRRR